MIKLIVLVSIAMLAGCGVETAGTAATAAAVKKQEIEEGKKAEEQMRKQVEQVMDQSQRRARQDSER